MKISIFLASMILLTLGSLSQEKTLAPIEEVIGNTYFDVQTTRSMQNRIHCFDDGTIGAVWNLAFDSSTWSDLGVGYNYYDGDEWGPYPDQSITSGISKNPTYTKFGDHGEIVVSEGENGLFINYRMMRGQGNWEEVVFPGPSGFKKLYSPQVVTTGNFNEIIHLLALKKDTSIQFEDDFQDNTGQVLYSRSIDYGTTWDILHYEFDFNQDYFGFSELSLVWSEPKNNTLAFMVGDYYTDLVLMKSIDGGDSWQKTILWEHPFPYFEHNVMLVDIFWANSGSQSLAMDLESKVHLTFAITSIISDSLNWTGHYNWWADGIVYWNEDRPVFSNNINALNSIGHPDSELEEDYSLIGWSQDINGNGTLEILPGSVSKNVYPSLGLSTMPTIYTSFNNQISFVWSSITEGYNDGQSNYRHLWTRSCFEDCSWWGPFDHLTSELIHIFDESVFPVFAANSDSEYLQLIYQYDNEPGLQDENIGGPPWSENNIGHMEIWYENPYYLFLLFNADQTTIHVGDTIKYTNNSYGSPGPITYQWYFEGGSPETSTEVHPSIVYNNEGLFDVTLEGSNEIYTKTVVMEDYISVLPQTNISEIIQPEEIKIYPNPGNGLFKINLNLEDSDDINVYNILGEKILNYPGEKITNQLKLDLTNQENGIYFIQIKTGSTMITKKIAVQH